MVQIWFWEPIPHVIEPVEWVTDEETGHEMLVYYSLGNFVNWTSGIGEGIANRMVWRYGRSNHFQG